LSLVAGVPAIADLISIYAGSLRFVTEWGSTWIGGRALPLADVRLAVVALLTGFAVLAHADLADPADDQPLPIDATSLFVINVITALCLLASIWAVCSGVDLDSIAF
jgi:hypothetical protein